MCRHRNQKVNFHFFLYWQLWTHLGCWFPENTFHKSWRYLCPVCQPFPVCHVLDPVHVHAGSFQSLLCWTLFSINSLSCQINPNTEFSVQAEAKSTFACSSESKFCNNSCLETDIVVFSISSSNADTHSWIPLENLHWSHLFCHYDQLTVSRRAYGTISTTWTLLLILQVAVKIQQCAAYVGHNQSSGRVFCLWSVSTVTIPGRLISSFPSFL